MKRDPYTKFISIMQDHGKVFNPLSISLGTVISSNPLLINIGDIQIDKDNILIADYLLEEYTRSYQTSNDKQTWGSDVYLRFTDTLEEGDLVAIIPTVDSQTYIILCRVVSL